jgi:prepilin-type N-terminal cleavage/methylation domain-containing protein
MYKVQRKQGFTIMEIVVATTIFSVVVAVMMSLFNYVLKINRRSEALRQATQGVRNFVEILSKEIRNGKIDYFVINGITPSPISPLGPCTAPAINSGNVSNTYQEKENKIGVISTESQESCYYFGDKNGNPQAADIQNAAGYKWEAVQTLKGIANDFPEYKTQVDQAIKQIQK